MDKRRKEHFKYSVIVPILVATVVGILFSAGMSGYSFNRIGRRGIVLSDYNKAVISQAPEFSSYGDVISARDLPEITGSTMLGTVKFSEQEFPLIYMATDANAVGKLNITNGKLPGSVGVTCAELFKQDSAKLRLLAKGDVITVETFYSGYELEVTDTVTVKSLGEINRLAQGVDRCVAIYTDSSVGVGVGNEYFVCVARVTQGAAINN